jgi:hypothetical protein
MGLSEFADVDATGPSPPVDNCKLITLLAVLTRYSGRSASLRVLQCDTSLRSQPQPILKRCRYFFARLPMIGKYGSGRFQPGISAEYVCELESAFRTPNSQKSGSTNKKGPKTVVSGPV